MGNAAGVEAGGIATMRSNRYLDREKVKPKDASDLTDFETARSEVSRLRRAISDLSELDASRGDDDDDEADDLERHHTPAPSNDPNPRPRRSAAALPGRHQPPPQSLAEELPSPPPS